MKKLFPAIAIVTLTSGVLVQAQDGVRYLDLSETLQQHSLEWVDVDNDGALDIVVFSTDPTGSAFVEAYRNEGPGFVFQSTVATEMNDASFYLTDYDLDNRIDVMVSGTMSGDGRTKVLLNNGDFTFTGSEILQAGAATLGLADLDMDGKRELIMSGDAPGRIMIYRQRPGGWDLVNDSLAFHASYLAFHDFNRDFYADIFISGEREDGSPVQLILANRKGFSFIPLPATTSIRDAAVTEADLDSDGFVDIIVSGADDAAQPVSKIFFGNGSLNPVIRDTTLVSGVVRQLFAGDMTSDGRVDVNVMSLTDDGLINVNLVAQQGEVLLPSDDVIDQRFGDADRDGDLDLMILRPGRIAIHENTTEAVNDGPSPPARAFAARIYDRLFVYWDRAGDDHTPSPSITYDLAVHGQDEELLVGEFDLIAGLRTKVSRGNIGHDNFIMLRDIDDGGYGFRVQGIDNAFHADAGGICEGQATPCEIAREHLTVCSNEAVYLEAPGQALWFSFADGYLGTSGAYTYEAARSDTLFSITPSEGFSCAALKVYNVQRNDASARTESVVRHACTGSTLHLDAGDGWDTVTWNSSVRGFLSGDPSIEFSVSGPDTVILQLSNAAGCSKTVRTAIVISEPQDSIEDMTYQILRGESVQLEAAVEGGVTYSWNPATGLDRSDIPDPVASPVANTEYIVTIRDSIGCAFEARVMILVENTAFVPTLFTPNQDGKNDMLKVYGLGSVGRFSFRIYNREGNLVFRTDDAAKASQEGWDGSVHGVIQPAGVYHWKIEGEYVNGKRLLLNGKETGSIVLIR